MGGYKSWNKETKYYTSQNIKSQELAKYEQMSKALV